MYVESEVIELKEKFRYNIIKDIIIFGIHVSFINVIILFNKKVLSSSNINNKDNHELNNNEKKFC